MSLDIPLFFLLIGEIFLFQWFAFIPAYLMQTEKFFDLIGSLTYVVIIVTAVFLSPTVDGRSILILVLILIWSIRLGVFLFRRIQRAGNDSRFDKIKPFFLRFFLTWSVQGLWISFTLSAALAAVTTNQRKELGLLSMIGLIVWFFGFFIEVTADYQKSCFRKKIENRNKFIKSGLWAISRHPNYFGEIVLWIGVAIIAIPVLHGWLWLSLISPVFVAFLIMCISGVPLLEKASDEKWLGQKEYELYKEQTPILIPKIFFLQKNKPLLLSHLKGIITMCYIVTNLLIASVPLLFLTALKLLFPFKAVQKRIYHLMTWLYSISTRVDDFFFWNFLGTEIEVQGEIKQSMHKTHLILSNHRSWTDILILQSLFNRKTPVLKFLIKKELRFLPIVGWICWAYDYPFLERNLNKKTFEKKETKIYLAQKLRKIKHSPATFVNFAEATRFTNLKREKQKSVYTYLLQPKVGGLQVILKEFWNEIHSIYDVTIVYYPFDTTFWDFLCGRCQKITVVIQQIEPGSPSFPMVNDLDGRASLEKWINQLWQKKDQNIKKIGLDHKIGHKTQKKT